MEKLIISKNLAKSLKEYKGSIVAGIGHIREKYEKELLHLRNVHDFSTSVAVVAYLLGGQEQVYEIRKDNYFVVWNTIIKDFYPVLNDGSLEEGVEIVICAYEEFEEADEAADNFNDLL